MESIPQIPTTKYDRSMERLDDVLGVGGDWLTAGMHSLFVEAPDALSLSEAR